MGCLRGERSVGGSIGEAMRGFVVLLVSVGVVGVVGPASMATSAAPSVGQGRVVFASYLPAYPLPDNFQANRTFVTGASARGGSELESGAVLSPDGSRYAVARSGSALWVSGVEGRQAAQVASSPSGTTISAIEWSHDGSQLAFVAGGALWVVGSDGAGLRELFAPDGLMVKDASWSPDGSRLAVFAGDELWLVATDGAAAHRLFQPVVYAGYTMEDVEDVEWSPTSAGVALTIGTDVGCITAYEDCSDWYVLTFDRDGSPIAKIGHADDVVWSPNGERLAFEFGPFLTAPDEVSIDTARPDGSGIRRLTKANETECWRHPHWLDATTVSYDAMALDPVSGCDPSVTYEIAFYVVRDDRGGRPVWDHRANTEWFSPDGSRVAFTNPYRDTIALYTANRNGTHRRRLTGPSVQADQALWSADGRRLAYTSAGCCVRDLRLTTLASNSVRTIAHISAGRTLYPVAITGTRVAYESQLPLSPVSLLWTMRADGSGLHRLRPSTVDESQPSWSPDGSRIAFSRDTSKGGNYATSIETMHADGTGMRLIAGGAKQADGEPSWSPDGKQLAYTDTDSNVVVVDADGSHPHIVATPLAGGWAALSSTAWSPDGSRIAYATGTDLMVINSKGGTPTSILHASSGLGPPAWSPDGSQLAFECFGCTPRGDQGGDGIAVVDSDGGGVRIVAADQGLRTYPSEGPPAWSADGRQLLFAGTSCTTDPDPINGPTAICTVDLDGSGLHPLTPPGVASFAPATTGTGA
jgi:Tol biopolymer transport system component